MEAPAHTAAVAGLRQWLGRMEQHGKAAEGVLPFGTDEIDAHLPTGGIALGHLHEILEGGPTAEYASLAAETHHSCMQGLPVEYKSAAVLQYAGEGV